jgi:hypothetical protein
MAMSLRRQYTLPFTVHGFSAPVAKLPRNELGIRPWFSGAVNPAFTVQLVSLFSALNTTSGQPLPVRLYSSTLVCSVLEPLASPS